MTQNLDLMGESSASQPPQRGVPQRTNTTASERDFLRSIIKDDSHSTGLNLPSWLDGTTEADPPPSMLPEGGAADIPSQLPTTFIGGTPGGGVDADHTGAARASSFWATGDGGADLLDPMQRAYTPSYQSAYSGDAWDQSSALSGLNDLAIDDYSSQMDAMGGGADDTGGVGFEGGDAYDPAQQDSYDDPMRGQTLLSDSLLPSQAQQQMASGSSAQDSAGVQAQQDAFGSQQQQQARLTASSLQELDRISQTAGETPAYSQEAGQVGTAGGDGRSPRQGDATSYADLAAGGASRVGVSAGVGRSGTLLAAPVPVRPPSATHSDGSSHGGTVPPGNLNLAPQKHAPQKHQSQPQAQHTNQQQQFLYHHNKPHQHQSFTPMQQTPGQAPNHSVPMDLVTPRAGPDDASQQALFAAALELAHLGHEPAKLDPSMLQQRSRSAAGGGTDPDGGPTKLELDTTQEALASDAGANPLHQQPPLPTPQSLFAGLPSHIQKQLLLESAEHSAFSPITPGSAGAGKDTPGAGGLVEKPKREDSYDKLKAFLGLDKDEYMRQLKATQLVTPDANSGLRKRANSDIGPRTPSGTTAMTFWGGITPSSTMHQQSQQAHHLNQQQQQNARLSQQQADAGGAGFVAGKNWHGASNEQASAALAMWRAPTDGKAEHGRSASGSGVMSPGSSGFSAHAMYSGLDNDGMMQVDQQITVMAVGQESAARSTMDPTLFQQQGQQQEQTQTAFQQPGSQWLSGPLQWGQGTGPGRLSLGTPSTSYGSTSPQRAGAGPPPSAWRFSNMAAAAAGQQQQNTYAGLSGQRTEDRGRHHRNARSEDFGHGSPGMTSTTSSDGLLVPPGGSASGSATSPSHRSHPYKPRSRSRRPSSASSRSVSSAGYSNGASPRHDGMGTDGGSDVGLEAPVNAQVTTAKTQAASASRRKAAALFHCPFPGCESTFTRALNLKGHIRSHNDEKPFKCGYPGCDRAFARAHDQKRHQKLHLNIRPHVCEYCGKTFARLDALNRHHKVDGTNCGTKGGEGTDTSRDASPEGQAPPVPPKDSPTSRTAGGRFGGHVL